MKISLILLTILQEINKYWTVGAIANFSYSRETAEFIDEALITDEFMRENLTVTGGFTNLRRGYISDGLFQNYTEIEQHAILIPQFCVEGQN